MARGSLALELYEAVELGPLRIDELAFTLPGLKFPVDLSGGVPMFRHRRGELQRLGLSCEVSRLSRWLSQRLRHVLGPLSERVALWHLPEGVGVGLLRGTSALAFDVIWAPSATEAGFVITRARGVGLSGPALGHALRAADTVFSAWGQRRGRHVVLADAVAKIGRAVLPQVGARAPRVSDARFSLLGFEDDEWTLEVDTAFAPPTLDIPAVRALELASLAAAADDAVAAGDVERARELYVAALERAPRHPELTLAVAEIDAQLGGRAEAALGLIIDAMPALAGGGVAADLLAETGDFPGAREAVASAARHEPFAALAALGWLRLAELSPSLREKLSALDAAVARAPGLEQARSARLSARLQAGDVRGAQGDAEFWEASVRGSRARHEVCRRVGAEWLAAGYVRDAGRWYERALRYVPNDAAATAGLARALLQTGQDRRALTLLERAARLSAEQGSPDAGILIDLATALARAGDWPAAVARLREVEGPAERLLEARALEAQFRSRLGDFAGASLAYARLRESAELQTQHDARLPDWLIEAAEFEQETHGDRLAAQRHLEVAVRLAPRSQKALEAYRQLTQQLAAERRRLAQPVPPLPLEPAPVSRGDEAVVGPVAESPEIVDEQRAMQPVDLQLAESLEVVEEQRAMQPVDLQLTEDAEPAGDDPERTARAAALESALRADPGNHQAALELLRLLFQLRRDQDVVALLAARWDDAEAHEQPELRGVGDELLPAIAERAEAAGRSSDAAMAMLLLERLRA